MMHEAACHNREKNGTTDFSQTVTARQNHACDLLAGAAAQQGRSFYSGLRPQEGATIFLNSAGVPMFRELFEQVGRLAKQVRVTRRLNKESRQPDCNRSKATRVMRLMEKGEVDGKHWAQVCKQLHGNLKAEAMQSCLGQLASSSLNLCTLTDCADAQSIRNILKLGEKGRPCHFCQGGPDSRVHWCHECPAWQPAFVQVALTASAHLATGGNSL